MPAAPSGEANDPFDSSKAEVESLLASARVAINRLRSYERQLLQQKQQQHARTGSSSIAFGNDDGEASAASPSSGASSSLAQRAERAIQEATGFLDNAADEVSLLRSVVDALKSGRVRKANMPHHVLANREDFVDESEQAVENLRKDLADTTRPTGVIAVARAEYAKIVEAQRASAAARLRARTASQAARLSNAGDPSGGRGEASGDGSIYNDGDDGSDNEPLDFEGHQQQQAKVRDEQNEALDRLHAGLTNAGVRASLIGLAVDEQNVELNRLGDDIAAVDSKLATQMAKVNKLLDEMSSKRKCGLITCLIFTAFVLFLLILTI